MTTEKDLRHEQINGVAFLRLKRGNSTWTTIKDLNPENTVLSTKKCSFIEISWTCYFHLHLSRIIRPNFNKLHSLQWITSTLRKPECLKLNRSFQKSLFHNFPDAILRQLLAESSNVFHKDVFFDSPTGEEKWILCKSPILGCHIPATKIKCWRVWQYKNDDTVYSCSITAPQKVMSNRQQLCGRHLNQYDGIGWFLRPSHDTGMAILQHFGHHAVLDESCMQSGPKYLAVWYVLATVMCYQILQQLSLWGFFVCLFVFCILTSHSHHHKKKENIDFYSFQNINNFILEFKLKNQFQKIYIFLVLLFHIATGMFWILSDLKATLVLRCCRPVD